MSVCVCVCVCVSEYYTDLQQSPHNIQYSGFADTWSLRKIRQTASDYYMYSSMYTQILHIVFFKSPS